MNNIQQFLEGRYKSLSAGEVLDTRESDRTLVNFVLSEVERELEKSKKIGDDFQCYDTNAFGQRTNTVIEKRLSSEDKAYNQSISDQITHLQAQIKELHD